MDYCKMETMTKLILTCTVQFCVLFSYKLFACHMTGCHYIQALFHSGCAPCATYIKRDFRLLPQTRWDLHSSIQWVVVICDQCNLPWTCRYKPAEYTTQHARLTSALQCLDNSHHIECGHSKYITMKFIQINTVLWLDDCTFGICSEKCEMQTASHQQTALKQASCPPCQTHLPRGSNCKSWRWNGNTIFLHTGRSNCEWLLLHNFALMQLKHLQHLSNLHNNFQFNAISHRWFMSKLIFYRRLAEWHHCHTFSQVHGLITSVI